jgi:hypothetical protein
MHLKYFPNWKIFSHSANNYPKFNEENFLSAYTKVDRHDRILNLATRGKNDKLKIQSRKGIFRVTFILIN